jgi:hypothetical protein
MTTIHNNLDDDNEKGNTSMTNQDFCALFTKVLFNPLLHSPDSANIRSLAVEHDFCLLVDNTMSNFLNVCVLSTDLVRFGHPPLVGCRARLLPHRGRPMSNFLNVYVLSTCLADVTCTGLTKLLSTRMPRINDIAVWLARGGPILSRRGYQVCGPRLIEALGVLKGTSLGTHCTLVCPYELLAHYHELDQCIAFGKELVVGR